MQSSVYNNELGQIVRTGFHVLCDSNFVNQSNYNNEIVLSVSICFI